MYPIALHHIFSVVCALHGAKADCVDDAGKNQESRDCMMKFIGVLMGDDMNVVITPNNTMKYYRRLCAT